MYFSLSLSPGSLDYGKYMVTLTMQDEANPDIANSDSVYIDILETPLKVCEKSHVHVFIQLINLML